MASAIEIEATVPPVVGIAILAPNSTQYLAKYPLGLLTLPRKVKIPEPCLCKTFPRQHSIMSSVKRTSWMDLDYNKYRTF